MFRKTHKFGKRQQRSQVQPATLASSEKLETRVLLSGITVAYGESVRMIHQFEDGEAVESGHGHDNEFESVGNSPGGSSHHFIANTGGDSHFAWPDQNPATADVVDLYYDFRPIGTYSNVITPAQKTAAETAMAGWIAAADGQISFTRNTTVPATDIINIGVGDLASFGFSSGPEGILALGGGTVTHLDQTTISEGIVWLDSAEQWDSVFGNEDPPGTFDSFTVLAHEIGHALGIGHLDDLPEHDIMDGAYNGEKITFSVNDQALIQVLYGSGSDTIPGLAETTTTSGDVLGTQLVNDDVIVNGSVGVGMDIVNGESFGFDTLRLKENNLRIHFHDTSSSASFPKNDWRIVINDSSNGGGNYFAVEDSTGGRIPFRIEAGAPADALYVESDGDVGFGTSNPVTELHATDGNTPTLRLEQNGTSGWTPQTWDVAGNEANFFIRDATNGSTLPFRIEPGAPTSSLYVDQNGNIGLGTATPDTPLDVNRAGATALIEDLSNTVQDRSLLTLSNNGGSFVKFENTDSGGSWTVGPKSNDKFAISPGGINSHAIVAAADGRVVMGRNKDLDTIGFDLAPDGNLTIAGTLTTPSSGMLKENFSDDSVLSRVVGLELLEWNYILDPANTRHFGPLAEDFYAVFGLGEDAKHISPSDMAGIAAGAAKELLDIIQAQDIQIAQLEEIAGINDLVDSYGAWSTNTLAVSAAHVAPPADPSSLGTTAVQTPPSYITTGLINRLAVLTGHVASPADPSLLETTAVQTSPYDYTAVPTGAYAVSSDGTVLGAEYMLKEVPSTTSAGKTTLAASSVTGPSQVLAADQVFTTDLIVNGSVGVGMDTVNGESFGFDTLRLKENNLRIHFDDTSSTSSFPSNDWRIVINDSSNGGGNYFAIEDSTGGRIPFRIEAGAPSNALYVDSGGDVGFGTSNPVVELHAADGDTPTLRLEQNGTSGWTPQTWDVAGNEANFFIRDATNGSTLPFRIRPGAPTSSIDIGAVSGNVGLGVAGATSSLQVKRSDGKAALKVDDTSSTAATRNLLTLSNNGGSFVKFENTDSGGSWTVGPKTNDNFTMSPGGTNSHTLIMKPDGRVVMGRNKDLDTKGFELSPDGNLTISGSLTQGSSRAIKENFESLDSTDVLDQLDNLPLLRWNYIADTADTAHFGPIAEDFYAAFGFGEDNSHIAPGDLSGITIAAIQEMLQRIDIQSGKIAWLADVLGLEAGTHEELVSPPELALPFTESSTASDSFLIHLMAMSGTDSQIDKAKGTSLLTAGQIRAAVTQLDTLGDVDGDGDFDANDSFLIHLVELSGTDFQIDQAKGASLLTAGQIRAAIMELPAAINALGTTPPSMAGSAAGQTHGVLPDSSALDLFVTPQHLKATLPTGLLADSVILDDVIVRGSVGVGMDIANGESFGFDTLRLKENNLRIHFDDTSSTSSFPSNDWRIVINDSSNGGGNYFAIEDSTGGRIPFRIEAGASANALYVESDGDVGFGTSDPVVKLHAADGNTPTLRLEQNGTSGWTPQTWDVAGNEANFFIRDATNGSTLPFRIRPSAPTSSLYVDTNGNIGLGTAAPAASLHVRRTDGNANVKIEETNGTLADRNLVTLVNKGAAQMTFTNTDAGQSWTQGIGSNGAFVISSNTTTGPELQFNIDGSVVMGPNGSNVFELDPSGNLTLAGSFAQSSSRTVKENFSALDNGKVLSSLADLELLQWNYITDAQDTRHFGPMAEDFHAAFRLGEDAQHIAPGDMAGMALAGIQQLFEMVSQNDGLLTSLLNLSHVDYVSALPTPNSEFVPYAPPVNPILEIDAPINSAVSNAAQTAGASTTTAAPDFRVFGNMASGDPPAVVVQGSSVLTANEGGEVHLDLSVSDTAAGSLQVVVDWGDEELSTLTLDPTSGRGRGILQMTHVYQDDDPTTTPSDDYVISIDATNTATMGTVQVTTTATVNNVAPTIANPTATALSGNSSTVSATIFDPGTDTWDVVISWGDGSADTLLPGQTSTAITQTHTFPDNAGPYNVTISVTDDDSGESIISTISVSNTAVVNFLQNVAINGGTPVANEGQMVTLTGVVPGEFIFGTVEVDWDGDNISDETLNLSTDGMVPTAFSFTHIYADDDPTGTTSDPYIITLLASSFGGGTSESTIDVTINNVAPVVRITATSLDQSGEVTLSGEIEDNAADTFVAATVDWGDGTMEPIVISGTSFSLLYTYADPSQSYVITVQVTDDDGGTGTQITEVSPALVVPVVLLSDVQVNSKDRASINEGDTVLLTGEVSETGTLEIDWDGDNVTDETLTGLPAGSFSVPHVYADDQSVTGMMAYPVDVTFTADIGGATANAMQLTTVSNVAPAISQVLLNDNIASADEGGTPVAVTYFDTVTLNGAFLDPGLTDVHTVIIDWGDGTSSTVSAMLLPPSVNDSESGEAAVDTGERVFTATHTYDFTTDTTFNITVQVSDENMGQDSVAFSVLFQEALIFDAPRTVFFKHTAAGDVSWDVQFSDDVTGVDASDFQLNVVPGGLSLTDAGDSNPSTYVLTATAVPEGVIEILQIVSDSGITNALGNSPVLLRQGLPRKAHAWKVDRTGPAPVISTTEANGTNAAAIPINVAFGEIRSEVFDLSDVLVTNGTASDLMVSADREQSYTFIVTPVAGQVVTVDIAEGAVSDRAGNPSIAATQLTIQPLTTAITRLSPTPTAATSVDFSVVFTEDVVNVDAADFVVMTTGLTTATASVSVNDAGDGDAATYVVTVTNVTGGGALGLDIASGNNIRTPGSVPVTQIPTEDEVYYVVNDVHGILSLPVRTPGNVVATVVGNDLRITPDDGDNGVSIFVNEAGDVVVAGVGGTTVNGAAEFIAFAAVAGVVPGRLRVAGSLGRDFIGAMDITVNGHVKIETGGDVDAIDILNVTAKDGLKIVEHGDDGFIDVFDSMIEGRANLYSDEVSAIAGTGNDTVTISNSTFLDMLNIGTGGGSDMITLSNVDVTGLTRILSGTGSDKIDLSFTNHQSTFALATDTGVDTVTGDNVNVTSDIVFDTGTGDDTVDFNALHAMSTASLVVGSNNDATRFLNSVFDGIATIPFTHGNNVLDIQSTTFNADTSIQATSGALGLRIKSNTFNNAFTAIGGPGATDVLLDDSLSSFGGAKVVSGFEDTSNLEIDELFSNLLGLLFGP